MKSSTILKVSIFAALIVLPVLLGFIALMYYLDVPPTFTGMLSALLAVIIAQAAVPLARRLALRLEGTNP